jgi:enoyl-CoA hydratase/carnithine racemase
MEMVLTGDFMKAQEAMNRGLVSRVVHQDKSLDEAIELAKKIGAMPRLICN